MRTSREEGERARTRLVDELSRTIGAALADRHLEASRAGLANHTPLSEHGVAMLAAKNELDKFRASSLTSFGVLPPAEEETLVNEAVSHVLGLGRLDPLLSNEDVSDIHVRGAHPVWLKYRDGRREQVDPIVESDTELIDLIRRAATRLTRTERRFDIGHPELNLQLPDGSRMFATMDVSTHPTMVIRRHKFDNSSLNDLMRSGMFSEQVGSFLAAAVRARRNIVIAGGTGSGKTTLLRALMNEVPPTERIVTIEDAYELGIDKFAHLHPDHDALQSRQANIEGSGEIDLAALTRMALRMDPDRVIVGEVRGAEAFPMILAMSQGNNGSMCTMHADSTRSVFPKLAAYVSMAPSGLPTETVNLLLASALHFVVHIEVADRRRRISSIREVVDADGNSIVSNEVVSQSSRIEPFASLRAATAEMLADHGFDARRWAR
jgi:pilus assembly protein CpaF